MQTTYWVQHHTKIELEIRQDTFMISRSTPNAMFVVFVGKNRRPVQCLCNFDSIQALDWGLSKVLADLEITSFVCPFQLASLLASFYAPWFCFRPS